MSLVKARLHPLEGGDDIEFMYNPTQLAFSRSISLEQAKGARTEKGHNKVSFKHPNPYSLKISNIVIDTYESGKNALTYINQFKKAVEFSQGEGENKRPPVYLFVWGKEEHLRCFVKTLSYKLTLFLPDGTPVRAIVDLDLEEVDLPISQPRVGAPDVSQAIRPIDSRRNRQALQRSMPASSPALQPNRGATGLLGQAPQRSIPQSAALHATARQSAQSATQTAQQTAQQAAQQAQQTAQQAAQQAQQTAQQAAQQAPTAPGQEAE